MALRTENLHAVERRGVDAPFDVDFDAVRKAGVDDGKETLPGRSASRCEVECPDVVRSSGLERPRLVVGPAVADVQHGSAQGERQPVWLVEVVDHPSGRMRMRVVAVDAVANDRAGFESLKMSVARVGEPNRAVALHDDVVGRVEGQGTPSGHDGLSVAGAGVERGDAGRRRLRSLLAHEASVLTERHSVCTVCRASDDRFALAG